MTTIVIARHVTHTLNSATPLESVAEVQLHGTTASGVGSQDGLHGFLEPGIPYARTICIVQATPNRVKYLFSTAG